MNGGAPWYLGGFRLAERHGGHKAGIIGRDKIDVARLAAGDPGCFVVGAYRSAKLRGLSLIAFT
jgi:hypothetical protein